MAERSSLSEVERIKAASQGLRGEVRAELDGPGTSVGPETEQLLKFHGVYSQDDRDQRRARVEAGEGPAHIFMARVALTGGALSAEQWRTLSGLARELADGSVRLTTRQAVQFHGVVKSDVRPLLARLHEGLMTTFGACGDVVRNVVMCPSLQLDHPEEAGLADELSAHFKPASGAHLELVVDGRAVGPAEPEPLYGATYLPRKFKIAIAHPEENCVDVLAQDVGLVALGAGRYAVSVGGGLGRSYAHPGTFARLGDWLGVVERDRVADLIEAVLGAYRDLGDRSERRRARLKYVVEEMGIAAFTKEVSRRFAGELAPLEPWGPRAADDHLGWRRSVDGTWRVGVRVAAGRVADRGGLGMLSAVDELAVGKRRLLLTPQQDLILAGIEEQDRPAVEGVLAARGVAAPSELGLVERTALACPALPTCGQALAEAERRLPEAVASLEGTLAQADVRRPVQLRVSGCPNGCSRAAVAEVGLVGRTKSSYDLYLGGSGRGDRLARLWRERVKLEEIGEHLAPLVTRWREEGRDGEGFGDFCERVLT